MRITSKIVGIRTTGQKYFAGHRWRRACWFEVIEQELHPTKGWRVIRWTRKAVPEHVWNKAPATEERFERTRPRRDRSPPIRLNETEMERARMRHAWYRVGHLPPGAPIVVTMPSFRDLLQLLPGEAEVDAWIDTL